MTPDVQTWLAFGQLLALIVVPVVAVVLLRAKVQTLTEAIHELTNTVKHLDARIDQHDIDIALLKRETD